MIADVIMAMLSTASILIGFACALFAIAYFLDILRKLTTKIFEKIVNNKVSAVMNQLGIKLQQESYWFSESEESMLLSAEIGKSLCRQPYPDSYTWFSVEELRDNWSKRLTESLIVAASNKKENS